MNAATLLLRQIHPVFIQQGRVTSQAFRPTPKDESLLSVYDGDMIEPEAACLHYTEQLGLQSSGVLSVTMADCAGLDLPARSDPAPFPEHAVIDFTGLEKNAVEKKAKQLRAKAETRGWLYLAAS